MAGNSGILSRQGLTELIPLPLRVIYYYLIRNNLFKTVVMNAVESSKDVLMVNQKLKIARYRVNHMLYRLKQMETLIEHNNPESYITGRNLNQLR